MGFDWRFVQQLTSVSYLFIWKAIKLHNVFFKIYVSICALISILKVCTFRLWIYHRYNHTHFLMLINFMFPAKTFLVLEILLGPSLSCCWEISKYFFNLPQESWTAWTRPGQWGLWAREWWGHQSEWVQNAVHVLHKLKRKSQIQMVMQSSMSWFPAVKSNRFVTLDCTGSTLQDKDEEPVPAETGQHHPFFRRSDSMTFLGCIPPNPFEVPLAEAIPLADQPHLLQVSDALYLRWYFY